MPWEFSNKDAACVADDVHLAVFKLLKGNEIEIAVVLGWAMKVKNCSALTNSLARICEGNGAHQPRSPPSTPFCSFFFSFFEKCKARRRALRIRRRGCLCADIQLVAGICCESAYFLQSANPLLHTRLC